MSLHTGAMTARRYHCPSEPPTGFRDSYAQQLAALGFRESSAPPATLERYGWVHTKDMLAADFSDLNEWCLGSHLVFTLRIDTWKIPTKLFKAHLAKRVGAWLKEHGRVRCPAAVRAELRESLQHELASRVMPKSTLIDIVWSIDDEIVLVDTQVASKNDLVCKVFFETFGVRLILWNPLDHMGVPRAVADRLESVTHYDFAGIDSLPEPGLVSGVESIVRKAMGHDGGEDTAKVVRSQMADEDLEGFDASMFNEWLASEFLVYLWFVTACVSCDLEVHGGVMATMWVDERIAFRGGRKDLDSTASVKSESAADDYVAMSALADQRLPSSMSLCLRVDEREYAFTLVANPPMDFKAVKLPTVVSSKEFDEFFYDRTFLLRELEAAVQALWVRFCTLRADYDDWYGQVSMIREWVRKAVDKDAVDEGE